MPEDKTVYGTPDYMYVYVGYVYVDVCTLSVYMYVMILCAIKWNAHDRYTS